MHSFLRPPSSHSGVPPNDVVLCSSIPDSSLVVNKEQPTDEVGVAQPTCVVIHEEYEWDLEHQHSKKDDSLPSEPPPFLPSFFGEPTIHNFVCVSSSTDAPIVDHSHESLDASPSFNNGEDKLFIEDPLDPSFVFFGNTEDEFVHFHLPLCLIHLIMRMSKNSLIFLIVAVMIHLHLFFIMIMNLSQLIF